jgi:hypothetical protein
MRLRLKVRIFSYNINVSFDTILFVFGRAFTISLYDWQAYLPEQVQMRKGTDDGLYQRRDPGEAGGWLYGKATVAVLDLKEMKAEIIDIR